MNPSGFEPQSIFGVIGLAIAAYVSIVQIRSNSRVAILEADNEKCKEQQKVFSRRLRHSKQQRIEDDKTTVSLNAEITSLKREIGLLKSNRGAVVNGFYVWAKLEDELILDVTSGSLDVLGYRPTQLIGKSIKMLLAPKHFEDHEKGINHAIETGSLRPKQMAIRGHAIHASGKEVEVAVTLDHVTHDGVKCVRAEIQQLGVIPD